jgi:hypothetical protein
VTIANASTIDQIAEGADLVAQRDDIEARPYDEGVEAYNLTILRDAGDWSLADTGDLVMTRNGDIQLGDIAYNGLFRLVQMWRYSEPHLRYLFATVDNMRSERSALDDALNMWERRRMSK